MAINHFISIKNQRLRKTLQLKINKIELLKRFHKNIAVRTYFENLISSRDQVGVFKSLDAHFGLAGQH